MNGEQGTVIERTEWSQPLSLPLIALILVFAALVIGAFTFAMATFIRAGKRDAATRRSRGVPAKDPLDPNRPQGD